MNTENGHLITDALFQELKKAAPELAEDYEKVPDSLARAARKKLGGRSEATIAKHSGGMLSRWASKRNQEKRKARRSMEKATKHAQRKGK